MSNHRYRVDVRPDGPNSYLLRVPELDGTNGIDEVAGKCEDLPDLEQEAKSLVATVLNVSPDEIEVDIRWDTSGQPLEVCRDRVLRAGEIRRQIGDLWSEYIDRVPRRFAVEPSETPDHRHGLISPFILSTYRVTSGPAEPRETHCLSHLTSRPSAVNWPAV